jgi:hypothetical protein
MVTPLSCKAFKNNKIFYCSFISSTGCCHIFLPARPQKKPEGEGLLVSPYGKKTAVNM